MRIYIVINYIIKSAKSCVNRNGHFLLYVNRTQDINLMSYAFEEFKQTFTCVKYYITIAEKLFPQFKSNHFLAFALMNFFIYIVI